LVKRSVEEWALSVEWSVWVPVQTWGGAEAEGRNLLNWWVRQQQQKGWWWWWWWWWKKKKREREWVLQAKWKRRGSGQFQLFSQVSRYKKGW
jgi:hypothetical protein